MKTYELDERYVAMLLRWAKMGANDDGVAIGVQTCRAIREMFPPQDEIKKVEPLNRDPRQDVVPCICNKIDEVIITINNLVNAVNKKET